ncbi:MAG: NADH-quinone oxidoreductase subunit C [Bacteroidetes bacterium]|nr:NADH-quinone oxidoreductase subunit C [Rhodothermia bacterium]MCS7155240.1 NADH-quinone oxidoreductase subunit C [Bacteroidota bacterium]MCX7907825.1 NADH-quinone oxidoreductase subunit C [Bacteroidota bacterium]MDW8138644.1 NADH-quinone oxidoreductase subunit C [Bacteroidota bacterium]MDW8284770.1 NADH-quinone oxidoreductase subunit C [Bacteroidota bacterium]
MTFDDVIAHLEARFPGGIREIRRALGETTILVRTELIRDVCRVLKAELGFNYLVDIAAVDRFTEQERFEVVYNLVALAHGLRLRLKVRCEESDPVVPSITPVYPNANWHEREAWDMMGIRFAGHPDLRRIYLPEDFRYHPLRKEFPLLGIPGSLPLPEKPESPAR